MSVPGLLPKFLLKRLGEKKLREVMKQPRHESTERKHKQKGIP